MKKGKIQQIQKRKVKYWKQASAGKELMHANKQETKWREAK